MRKGREGKKKEKRGEKENERRRKIEGMRKTEI